MGNKYRIMKALNMWNDFTSPSKLRTDVEHRRCSKAAKKVMSWLRRHAREGVDYKEMSSGCLWPIS